MWCTLLVFELTTEFDHVAMWLCLCWKAVLHKNLLLFSHHSTGFCPLSFLWPRVHFPIKVSNSSVFPTFPLKSPAIRITDIDRFFRSLLRVVRLLYRSQSSSGCLVVLSVVGPCTLIVMIMWSIRFLSGQFLFFDLSIFSCSTQSLSEILQYACIEFFPFFV